MIERFCFLDSFQNGSNNSSGFMDEIGWISDGKLIGSKYFEVKEKLLKAMKV